MSGERSKRVLRVEKSLRQILGEEINRKSSLFDGALVSLIEAKVSPDLRAAKIFVSVYGGDERDALDTLEELRPFFQQKIGKELPMKFCPKLKFLVDQSVDRLVHVSEVLKKVNP